MSGYSTGGLDPDLQAIADLSSTGLIERTGSGTAAANTITSYAKTLLDDANVAAAQTTLALVPGTNVQAYSARLQEIGSNFAAASDLQVLRRNTGGTAIEYATPNYFRIAFMPHDAELPSTNFATFDEITDASGNNPTVLAFNATTATRAIFRGQLTGYDGTSTLNVALLCTMASATSGGVVFNVSFEELTPNSAVAGTSAFGTARQATATVPGVNRRYFSLLVAFSPAQSGLATNLRWFRVRVERAVDDASDTATGNCELHGISIVPAT